MRTMSGSPCLHYDCSNRNSFGYCKTTVCINEHYQQEQWGSPSTTNKSESVVKKPQTHADRIRSMTDEELANQLAAEQYVGIRTFLLGFDKELLEDLDEEIKMAWPESVKEKLNWLKQETET